MTNLFVFCIMTQNCNSFVQFLNKHIELQRDDCHNLFNRFRIVLVENLQLNSVVEKYQLEEKIVLAME